MPSNDRVLPCLLDRLTAGKGTGETGTHPMGTMRNYQQSVLRDLHWLLNANCTLPEDEAEDFPEVANSVVNFGTRDFCGVCASSLNIREVERELIEIIQNFEPRIIRRTLSVK